MKRLDVFGDLEQLSKVDSTVIEKIKNVVNLVKEGKIDEASTLWRENFNYNGFSCLEVRTENGIFESVDFDTNREFEQLVGNEILLKQTSVVEFVFKRRLHPGIRLKTNDNREEVTYLDLAVRTGNPEFVAFFLRNVPTTGRFLSNLIEENTIIDAVKLAKNENGLEIVKQLLERTHIEDAGDILLKRLQMDSQSILGFIASDHGTDVSIREKLMKLFLPLNSDVQNTLNREASRFYSQTVSLRRLLLGRYSEQSSNLNESARQHREETLEKLAAYTKNYKDSVAFILDYSVADMRVEIPSPSWNEYALTFAKGMDVSGLNFTHISINGSPVTKEVLEALKCTNAERALFTLGDVKNLLPEDQDRFYATLEDALNAPGAREVLETMPVEQSQAILLNHHVCALIRDRKLCVKDIQTTFDRYGHEYLSKIRKEHADLILCHDVTVFQLAEMYQKHGERGYEVFTHEDVSTQIRRLMDKDGVVFQQFIDMEGEDLFVKKKSFFYYWSVNHKKLKSESLLLRPYAAAAANSILERQSVETCEDASYMIAEFAGASAYILAAADKRAAIAAMEARNSEAESQGVPSKDYRSLYGDLVMIEAPTAVAELNASEHAVAPLPRVR